MGILDGKVAIVTGAGRLRGIGRASAVALAKEGLMFYHRHRTRSFSKERLSPQGSRGRVTAEEMALVDRAIRQSLSL